MSEHRPTTVAEAVKWAEEEARGWDKARIENSRLLEEVRSLKIQVDIGRAAVRILSVQPDLVRSDTGERGDAELNEIITMARQAGLLDWGSDEH